MYLCAHFVHAKFWPGQTLIMAIRGISCPHWVYLWCWQYCHSHWVHKPISPWLTVIHILCPHVSISSLDDFIFTLFSITVWYCDNLHHFHLIQCRWLSYIVHSPWGSTAKFWVLFKILVMVSDGNDNFGPLCLSLNCTKHVKLCYLWEGLGSSI